MLEYLGHATAAAAVERAVQAAIADGHTTRDLGGALSTAEAGAAVRERIQRP